MQNAEAGLKASKESVVAEGDQSIRPDLRLLHFNDVYHIEPGSRDPVGGIARFQSLHSYYKHGDEFVDQPDLITLFSGDAFNPSLESTVTKGGHMVNFLNNLSISAACVGNHDLDFGLPQFQHLTSLNPFPWLLANVNLSTGDPLVPTLQPTHLLTHTTGLKIGLIGLAEQEWLSTVNALPPDLIFVSACETANKYSPLLREQGADMIVVLAHQREANDLRLAEDCEDVDLILGGHDHQYRWKKVNGTHVLCSGTDFRQMSYIEARRRKGGEVGEKEKKQGQWDFTITRRDIVSAVPQHAETVEAVKKLSAGLSAKLDKPIGYTAAPLDARFTTVRAKESNLGNFVADVLRNYYGGDCALIVGGTFRGDVVYPPGVLKLRDVMDCFPFEDPTVMVKVSGKKLWEALQHAVSEWPKLEGRFPQVSGIEMAFDPKQNPRVRDVRVQGEKLEEEKEYKLVTRFYTTQGGDGFSMLKSKDEEEYLVNDENGQLISQLLRQYFMSLRVLGKWKRWSEHLGNHWDEVQCGVEKAHPAREPKRKRSGIQALNGKVSEKGEIGEEKVKGYHEGLSDSEDDEAHVPAPEPRDETRERELNIIRKLVRKWWRLAGLAGRHPSLCGEAKEDSGVAWAKGVCPKIEGRIKIIGELDGL